MLDRRLKYIILLLLFLSGFVSCGDVEVGTKESSVSNSVLTETQQTIVEKTVPATESSAFITSCGLSVACNILLRLCVPVSPMRDGHMTCILSSGEYP